MKRIWGSEAIKTFLDFIHWQSLTLIFRPASEPFRDDELPKVPESMSAQYLGQWIQKELENENNKCLEKTPSLVKVLIKIFWFPYLSAGILLFISSTLKFIQPIVVLKFVQLKMLHEKAPIEDINLWTIVFVLSIYMKVIVHKQYIHLTRIIGMQVNAACSFLIFKRILKKRGRLPSDLHPINLLINDVVRVEIALRHLHWLWVGFLFFVATCVTVYLICDYVVLVCVFAVYIIFTATIISLSKLLSSAHKAMASKTDERMRLLGEVISGIQVVKLYAWEKPFTTRIDQARTSELRNVNKVNIFHGFFDSCYLFVDRIQMLLTFVAYTFNGKRMETYEVFGMILLMIISRSVVTTYVPLAIAMLSECITSLQRIQLFLGREVEPGSAPQSDMSPGRVLVNDVSAAWTPGVDVVAGASLTLAPGTLCAVVGPVGSGKSSLVQVLLSELRPRLGRVCVGGRVSYAAQESWTFHGTVRENVVFGEALEEWRYEAVLRVCGLREDLARLPHGDGTLVGERGVRLSGGQRARVGLARAVYKRADIYILDDPLSAVDTNIAKHIFEECITGFLKDKTRIIVTHHLHNLPYFDHVVIMNNGKIEHQGIYDDVKNNLSLFSVDRKESFEENDDKSRSLNADTTLSDREKNEAVTNISSDYTMADIWQYLRGGSGYCTIAVYFLLLLLNQVIFILSHSFSSFWSSITVSFNEQECFTYIGLYAVSILMLILFTVVRIAVSSSMLLRASRSLHESMVRSVLASNMRYFHTTSTGKVLAYFSGDICNLDEQMPRSFDWLGLIGLFILTSIVTTATVNPLTVSVSIPITILTIWIIMITISTSKKVINKEMTRRDQAFCRVSDTINGLFTIRALDKSKLVLGQFNSDIEKYTSSLLLSNDIQVTKILYVGLCGASIIAANSIIFMKTGLMTDASSVGFGFLFTLFIEDLVNRATEQLCGVISHFPSVKHCASVTNLAPEELHPSDKVTELVDWPGEGAVEFRDVNLRYNPAGPYALKNLSFRLEAREKVGVVGRTGAGKTSLVTALLRLAQISGGAILVDSVDIHVVPLTVLRRNITVIPQEPVLFSGSVRYNLDPCDELEDAVLWEALKNVGLEDVVRSLDAPVEERGCNWSTGQRQLLCLARAAVRKSKVLVLDEATASVDPATDSAIQMAIRRLFIDCTVLTIAHRINTVMDSDRIIVMDTGRIVEFDKPSILLQDIDSYFYKLAKDSGSDMKHFTADSKQE